MILLDGPETTSWPIHPAWGVTKPASASPPSSSSWRALFSERPPAVTPHEAFSALSLYPADGAEIGEPASQPFVTDYLEDLGEEDPVVRRWLARSRRIRIDGLDAGITSLMRFEQPRDYTVVFRWPALAQRQAQAIWNYLAQTKRLEWLSTIRFRPHIDAPWGPAGSYDGIYVWIPFIEWSRPDLISARLRQVKQALVPSGLAFVVGPPDLPGQAHELGWTIQAVLAVEDLPTFQMHRHILPQARLKAGVTLYRMPSRP